MNEGLILSMDTNEIFCGPISEGSNVTDDVLRLTATHILRRGKGYRIRIGTDWVELSVAYCEPPDRSDAGITDAVRP